jgi:hypothetical protein
MGHANRTQSQSHRGAFECIQLAVIPILQRSECKGAQCSKHTHQKVHKSAQHSKHEQYLVHQRCRVHKVHISAYCALRCIFEKICISGASRSSKYVTRAIFKEFKFKHRGLPTILWCRRWQSWSQPRPWFWRTWPSHMSAVAVTCTRPAFLATLSALPQSEYSVRPVTDMKKANKNPFASNHNCNQSTRRPRNETGLSRFQLQPT